MQAKTLGVVVIGLTVGGISAAWAQEGAATKPVPSPSASSPSAASSSPAVPAGVAPATSAAAPTAPTVSPMQECESKGGEWRDAQCSMEKKTCVDAGNKWNEQTRKCETKQNCPQGTVVQGSACVPVAPVVPVCQSNEHMDQGRCVANAPVVQGEKDKVAEKKPRPTSTLGLEALVGLSGRIGAMSAGYESDERAGMLYGAGVFYSPNRTMSFGLGYSLGQGGSEQYGKQNSLDTGKITRTFHTTSLQARIYPVRSETIGLYVGLLVGAAFQTASATGSDQTSAQAPLPFKANSDPSAALALGAGVGFDYDIDDDFAMLSSLNFTNYQFSSDPMKGMDTHAIAGAGSTSQLDFRFALQYRFDLTGKKTAAAANTPAISSSF